MFRTIYRIIINKYFITFIIFLVWMIFFDNYSFVRQSRLLSSLHELRKEKNFYIEEIESNRKASEELMTDMETLEKFAREKYLMKRENEDIYLIVEQE